MTTKEFYEALTADGAKYQYIVGKTPVLPTKEYADDFEVTPADLKNVVIKVDGKEITSNTAMLTAGTYTVDVTADDCEPLSKEITISADIATHTQAFELAYKSADYTELDKAEKAAKALNKDDYEDFSEVQERMLRQQRLLTGLYLKRLKPPLSCCLPCCQKRNCQAVKKQVFSLQGLPQRHL